MYIIFGFKDNEECFEERTAQDASRTWGRFLESAYTD